MPEQPQNLANHAKVDPLFHYFVLPVAAINFGVVAFATFRNPTLSQFWMLVLSAAFVLAVFKIRTYSLKVQDRLIRLEESLRMQRLLPPAALSRLEQLRPGQFVALRFASDEELPHLVEQTVANSWKGKAIKGAIRNWRADHFRV